MAVKNTVIKQEFDYLLNHFGSKVTFFHTDPSNMNYDPTYDEYYGGTLQLIGDGNLQAIITTKPAEIVDMYQESGAYPFKDLNQTVIFKCSANDVKKAGLVDDNFNFTYADDERTFPVEGILNETYIRYRGEFYMCVDVRKALIYQGETSAVYFTAELDIGFKKSIYQNSMYGGNFTIEVIEPTEYYTVYVDEVALPTQYRAGDIVTLTVPTKEGYIFDGWETYDTVTVSAENTFVMVAQDIYITSKWIEEVVRYNVYVDSVLYGAYAEGETVTLIPTQQQGYNFKNFTSNDVTISAQNTFTMIAQNVYVTAVYVAVFEVYVDNTYYTQAEVGETVSIDAGTKTNYTFDYWSSTSQIVIADSQSARTSFTMISAVVYLTTHWTANFWTVTVSQSYGYNGEYTVTKGQSFTLQHGSRAENYGFTNWVITSGTATGDLTQDTAIIYPTSNVEIRAEWTKLGDYSVTYSGYTHAKTWHFEGDTVTVEAPAKDGYDFGQFTAYWYEVGTKKYIQFADYTGMNNPNSFTMPAGNVNLTATYDAWAYTVTFKVDNETYHTQQVAFSHKVSKPTDPVKEGYDFVEWRYNGSAVNFNDEITQDRTYTAYFTAQVTYRTVTLYDGGNVYQTYQVVDGQAISTAVQTLPEPTHSVNQRFNGWFNAITGTQLTLQTTISADTNYVSNYTTLYSISYVGYTHSTDYAAQGETVSVSAPSVTGKNFTGWTSNEVLFVDDTAQNTSFTMVATDVTVTASYADIYYSITFEVDSQTYATDTVIYGSTVSAPATNPTKQYYTFNEWKYNNATADFTENIYENRTYTADFTQDTYTLTYMVDTDTYTTATVLGGNSIGSFPADPTAPSGYEFNGWKYNGNTIYTSYVPSTDMTLTASFVEEVVAQEVLDIDQTVAKDICYAEYELHWKSTNWLNYTTWQNQQVTQALFTRNLDDSTRPNDIEHFNLPMYILSEKCCKDMSHRSTTPSNRGVRNSSNAHPFDYLPINSEESLSSSDTTVTNPLATKSLVYMARHTKTSTPESLFDASIVTYSKWHYDENDEDLQNAPHPPILWLEDTGSGYIPHAKVCCMTYNIGDSTYGKHLLCYCRAVTAIGNGWYRYEWVSDTSSCIYGNFGYDIAGYFSYDSNKGDTIEYLSANPPT